jgi:7-cyano-7-deazaguanine reductase
MVKPLDNSPLGKHSAYIDHYTPSLLFQLDRQPKRTELSLTNTLPFHGVDYWTAYEISWLNQKGKPHIAIGEFAVPADSRYIFESKSLKLYLNSFNQTKLDSVDELQKMIAHDLSEVCGKPVAVRLYLPGEFNQLNMTELVGVNLDNLDIEIDTYETDPNVLKTHNKIVTESVTSNLLKSHCLVTNQPDWGSVQIEYTGPQIDHESLLRYIVSFRQHNEFHEQCVERIFVTILTNCHPEKLSVYARYTRRGGIDINPFRTNYAVSPRNIRNARQ